MAQLPLRLPVVNWMGASTVSPMTLVIMRRPTRGSYSSSQHNHRRLSAGGRSGRSCMRACVGSFSASGDDIMIWTVHSRIFEWTRMDSTKRNLPLRNDEKYQRNCDPTLEYDLKDMGIPAPVFPFPNSTEAHRGCGHANPTPSRVCMYV